MPRATKQPDAPPTDPQPETPPTDDAEPITEAAGPIYLTTADLAAFLDRYDALLIEVFAHLRRRVPGQAAAVTLRQALARARADVLGENHGSGSDA